MDRVLAILLLCCALAGCGGGNNEVGLFDFLQVRDFDTTTTVEVKHPEGPIAEPEIPPELAEAAALAEKAKTEDQKKHLRYQVLLAFSDESRSEFLRFETRFERLDEALNTVTGTVSVLVPKAFKKAFDNSVQAQIAKSFTNSSLLEELSSIPLLDAAGLEQRMRADLKTAQDVLNSFGFYGGKPSGQVIKMEVAEEEDTSKSSDSSLDYGARQDEPPQYIVEIFFDLGPRYTIGHSPVRLAESDYDARQGQMPDEKGRRALPASLADVGLPEGEFADADVVLSAVNAVRDTYRNRGYPLAKIKNTRYFLDHSARTLEAELDLESGPLVFMGALETRGETPVELNYFLAMQNWEQGKRWNQSVIDDYREALRQTGLFAGVEISPAEEENALGQRNVVVQVQPSAERTIGGALRYDTDLGFGVLGYWEHRNLSHRGDKLRFELPVWEVMQEFAGSYRQPFFIRNDQDLLINGGLLHEDNDSYTMLTSSGSLGIERRLDRHWTGTVRVRAEGGSLEESGEKERNYYMLGVPLALTFNNTNNPLDSTKGVRLTFSPGPYFGYYENYFTALRYRLDGRFFWNILHDKSLVLGFRASYGSLLLADAPEVPPSIRFYSGGGGSVRGYEYRSVGPRNENNDPLGGDSMLEFSLETRFRFSDEWGVVLFVDCGMVYEKDHPDFSQDWLWGAGAGIRYYTVLGPIRFDVATPLNPRDDDSSIQLYISIGQSF